MVCAHTAKKGSIVCLDAARDGCPCRAEQVPKPIPVKSRFCRAVDWKSRSLRRTCRPRSPEEAKESRETSPNGSMDPVNAGPPPPVWNRDDSVGRPRDELRAANGHADVVGPFSNHREKWGQTLTMYNSNSVQRTAPRQNARLRVFGPKGPSNRSPHPRSRGREEKMHTTDHPDERAVGSRETTAKIPHRYGFQPAAGCRPFPWHRGHQPDRRRSTSEEVGLRSRGWRGSPRL